MKSLKLNPLKKTPLILPSWLMYIVYFLHGIFGWMVAVTSSLGPNASGSLGGALAPYGIAIGVTAYLALIVSFFGNRFMWTEMILAGILTALMSTYIFSVIVPLFEGDLDAIRRIAIVILAVLLPLFRALTLANYLIRRKIHGG